MMSIVNVEDLRNVYDKVESNFSSLESIGVSMDTYGTFLAPEILKLLPQMLRIGLIRRLPDMWALGLLLKDLRGELNVREKCMFTCTAMPPDKELHTPSVQPSRA